MKGWLTPVQATPGNTLSQLAQLARNVYEEPVSAIRFQAVLVNGGVDDDNLQYWADNLFLPPPVPPSTKRRYYCSNCQRNADCLALLLHCEEIPREMNYELILRYARQRCRFAAAVLANIDDPQLHQMAGDAEWVNLVEQWSEQHLEQIFCFLALQLENVRLEHTSCLEQGPASNRPGALLICREVPRGFGCCMTSLHIDGRRSRSALGLSRRTCETGWYACVQAC